MRSSARPRAAAPRCHRAPSPQNPRGASCSQMPTPSPRRRYPPGGCASRTRAGTKTNRQPRLSPSRARSAGIAPVVGLVVRVLVVRVVVPDLVPAVAAVVVVEDVDDFDYSGDP